MEKKHIYALFAAFGVILFLYTFIFVDETHTFVLNAGWEANLIEAKWLFYLIAAMGVCLWLFYHFFASFLYTDSLIYLHQISYILLAFVLILWDNNSFSLKEAVDSNSYSSIHEIRGEYHGVMQRYTIYRSLFWLLLLIQPVGLINLLLGFIKPNKD